MQERNKALYLYKNRFCLIWKYEGGSFNKTIHVIKILFAKIDN